MAAALPLGQDSAGLVADVMFEVAPVSWHLAAVDLPADWMSWKSLPTVAVVGS